MITTEMDEKKPKAPVLVWKEKELRVVVVYFASGLPAEAVLEKLEGYDALGAEIWKKQPPTACPKEILRAFAVMATDDCKLFS